MKINNFIKRNASNYKSGYNRKSQNTDETNGKVTLSEKMSNLSRETALKMNYGELGQSLNKMPETARTLIATGVDVLSSENKILHGSSTFNSPLNLAISTAGGALCAAAGAAGSLLGGVPGGIASIAIVTLIANGVENMLSPHEELDLSLKPLLMTALGAALSPAGLPVAIAGGAIGIHGLDLLQKFSLRADIRHE